MEQLTYVKTNRPSIPLVQEVGRIKGLKDLLRRYPHYKGELRVISTSAKTAVKETLLVFHYGRRNSSLPCCENCVWQYAARQPIIRSTCRSVSSPMLENICLIVSAPLLRIYPGKQINAKIFALQTL